MNLPIWSFPSTPFNSSTTMPLNYYSYPYMQSPFHAGAILNSSFQTSLNSSSGYESASHETSLIEPCFSSPSPIVKDSSVNYIYQPTKLLHNDNKIEFEDSLMNLDEETDDSMIMMGNEENYYGRKKRRVLSRPQRQEANRRERQRMDIINEAYERLRNVLPFKKGRKRQKMSRMDTVDGAIRHIHSLLETLHGPNYNPNWAK